MSGLGKQLGASKQQGKGQQMMQAIEQLLPVCRSITGGGLRQTLAWLAERLPLEIQEIASGTQVSDWTIPPEWNIRQATLTGPDGSTIADLNDSPLCVLNYSQPRAGVFDFEDLAPHLFSDEARPNWIPYRTSYYAANWGFCLPYAKRQQLTPGQYTVKIDSDHNPAGSLTLGEVFLPGLIDDEILVSCHVCHPGMANDNLSALAIAWKLIEHLSQRQRRYSYRFVFAPGTIGALAWLATNRPALSRIKGGLVLSLLGDSKPLTYKRSRYQRSRIDTIFQCALRDDSQNRFLDFAPTGYDERQYNSLGYELPVGRLSRSCEGEYAEYHSSGDNLQCVSAEQLTRSLTALENAIALLEEDVFYRCSVRGGEPQLGKRGVYSADGATQAERLWLLSQSDGSRGVTEIAGLSGIDAARLHSQAETLVAAGLLVPVSGETARKAGGLTDLHKLVPGGCHTYAKGDDQFPSNAPESIFSGEGCWVTAADGRRFIEYGAGLRSVGLGHAYPVVVEAAHRQMLLGSNFTRPASVERDAAQQLSRMIPTAEMVKFCKNGSDATTAAIRLARAYTGRTKIAICRDQPFFSVDDWFMVQTPMSAGIPADVAAHNVTFPYNDVAAIEGVLAENRREVACLIMEAATYETPNPGYLQAVQALCRREGVVFILDEMITGFRWHNGGAQAEYGLQPDLSTFGKALGNGFSVAALIGRRDIMELGGLRHSSPRVFLLSSTHGAETHCLAAALATMKVYEQEPVIEHLHRQGEKLRSGLRQIANDLGISDYFWPVGRSCNLVFATANRKGERCQAMRTLLLQETIKRGVLAPSLVVNYSHSDSVIDRTLDAFDESLKVYRAALEDGVEKYLVGPASQPVYRKYN